MRRFTIGGRRCNRTDAVRRMLGLDQPFGDKVEYNFRACLRALGKCNR